MTAEECAFFLEGLCVPPEEYGGCQWAKPKLGGLMYCCANTSVLFSEKDFGAQQIKNLFSGKEWEAQQIKNLFSLTVSRAKAYSRELDMLSKSVFFEEGGE